MDTVSKLLSGVALPKMYKAVQAFDRSTLTDPRAELDRQLSRPEIASRIAPGMRIAITCGSRRVDNYPMVIRTLVDMCKARGAKPFIVPAMGSHGGAVAEGQRQICASLGVTEETMGCPLLATMEVTRIGQTADGTDDVYIDRNAAEADGIIITNRIKMHAGFRGPYESGLMKIMTIGLGKQHGASLCHRRGYKYFAKLIPAFGNAILKNANVLFGVGLVEDAYDNTYSITALTPDEIPVREPELLLTAKSMMPRFLFPQCDALIIDWTGKDINGSGMDPNVTGRFSNPYCGEPGFTVKSLAALDLTEASHGNIHGLGRADVINRRIFKKANLAATYPNCITSTTLSSDRIPVMMDNDRETIQCAIKTGNSVDPARPWVVRIRDTLHLSEIWVSEGLADELRGLPGITVTTEEMPWSFNDEGNLW